MERKNRKRKDKKKKRTKEKGSNTTEVKWRVARGGVEEAEYKRQPAVTVKSNWRTS